MSGTKMLKQPRVGDVVECATGPEVVQVVKDHGQRLMTTDRAGRVWTRERDRAGVWMVSGREESYRVQ